MNKYMIIERKSKSTKRKQKMIVHNTIIHSSNGLYGLKSSYDLKLFPLPHIHVFIKKLLQVYSSINSTKS